MYESTQAIIEEKVTKMKKTIIINSAGSGIGAATTKAFMEDGHKVGLISRRVMP